jgi:dihydroorotate dehydrogenase
MSFYHSVVRPILFQLPPDQAHAFAQLALRSSLPWRALAALAGLAVDDPRLRTRFAGVELPSPVGLAAGFDKNCQLIAALSHLGFGFLTVGSIMPETRIGNPFPRLVRYVETRSLADAMGVPSRGLAYCVAQLSGLNERSVPIFANVGGFSAQAIATSFLAVEPYVDGVEISLMCPNLLRAGERFDDIGLLKGVLARIAARRKPAIVRIPNDTARSNDRVAEMIELCVAAGVEGLKVGGGRPVAEPRRSVFGVRLCRLDRRARHQPRAGAGIGSACGRNCGDQRRQQSTRRGLTQCPSAKPSISPRICPSCTRTTSGGYRVPGRAIRTTARPTSTRISRASPRAA